MDLKDNFDDWNEGLKAEDPSIVMQERVADVINLEQRRSESRPCRHCQSKEHLSLYCPKLKD